MLLAMARSYAFADAAETSGGRDIEMNVKPRLTASNKPRVSPMRTIAAPKSATLKLALRRPAFGRPALMLSALASLIAAMLTPSPVRGQTYDPRYPVCLQTYGITGNYIACGYTSMDQCRLSAKGRAAQCIVNPYFAGTSRGDGFRRPQ
jgi:hypothetical protein